MIIPIMIALVMNFLAVMVVLRVHAEFAAALGLATQSAASAPANAADASCSYAGVTFFSTMYGTPVSATGGPCFIVGDSFLAGQSGPWAQPAGQQVRVTGATPALGCTSRPTAAGQPDYLSGGPGYVPPPPSGAPPGAVTCNVTITYDFNKTALGLFVLWIPTMSLSDTVEVPNTRQCAPARTCT